MTRQAYLFKLRRDSAAVTGPDGVSSKSILRVLYLTPPAAWRRGSSRPNRSSPRRSRRSAAATSCPSSSPTRLRLAGGSMASKLVGLPRGGVSALSSAAAVARAACADPDSGPAGELGQARRRPRASARGCSGGARPARERRRDPQPLRLAGRIRRQPRRAGHRHSARHEHPRHRHSASAPRLVTGSGWTRPTTLRFVTSCAARQRCSRQRHSCATKPSRSAPGPIACGCWRRASTPKRSGRAAIGRAVKARLGISGPMVIAVGALKKRKGFDLLIDALSRIVTPATLVICGDGEELGPLRQQAGAAGLSERVRFAGNVSRAEIPDYFAAADVFVHAAELEAAGNVVLEALASRLRRGGHRQRRPGRIRRGWRHRVRGTRRRRRQPGSAVSRRCCRRLGCATVSQMKAGDG